ncbi:hypothetical protein C2G38_2263686 [Gigaspora rosea]|uniref:Uncharacterized protein n=1 Tax=Gigaspora rosea TaxID=44941 RepID=A0A397UML9_9GLOM|nr:hypothetical protein C2G38_2263686 [Gigaspora rosea]
MSDKIKSKSKQCEECGISDSCKFRSLKNEKWREAERNGLVKVTWKDGIMLCHKCYMDLVENPLQRIKKGTKRVRVSVEEIGNEIETREAEEIQVGRAILEEGVEVVYENEEDTIIREEIEAIIRKNIMNEELESARAYYLDSVGTSNEGLNTLANIGITTTARAVDRKKRQFLAAHGEYVEKVLENHYSESALMLNVDDYHNIHVQRQPDTTSTSWAAHMATIIANPCPISAIPRNGALNPKIVDNELILKHLDERFIKNLGVSYHDRRQNYIGKCSDDSLIEQLTLHSYDDRLAEKKSNRHIQNTILFDFVESSLKSVEDYTKALQVVYNQRPMQEYLSNNAIPIVADWPGQFFIRKAIAHRLLLNNEIIPSFVTAFVPMIGPLHVSLNSRELVFKKNWFLFNNVYKGIFGQKKELGYEITDRHFPRGFVMSRKPFTTVLCDYLRCDRTDYANFLDDGKVLSCGHGYHNHCLEKCQFKCIICLEYLRGEITKNINSLKVSMKKKLGENEFIEEDTENIIDDNLDDSEAVGDVNTIENLLKNAKKSFSEL